ncbi:MAG: hypothetical protein HY720_32510 [Planctomycetes bacterium]|nr:hypothetical protein [Planctomycetota bacterium]
MGARLLDSFDVAPLPDWRFAVPRIDFVAAPGFALAPSPGPPSETNDYLVLHWPDDSPYRWVPGAEAGDPESLYRFAVLRERDAGRAKPPRADALLAEALKLHRKCVALTDPASRDLSPEALAPQRVPAVPMTSIPSGT